VKVEFAQLAPVVAGPDHDHAVAGHRLHRRSHAPCHRLLTDAVDHDFVSALGVRIKLGGHAPPQSRAVTIRCRGLEVLVSRANLAAAAHHTARKRRDGAGHLGNGLHAAAGGCQSCCCVGGLQDDVPAGDPFLDSDRFDHHEFAVHDRDAPVSYGVKQFALLVAITEISQVPSQRDPCLRLGQSIVNGGRRAGHQALPRAVGYGLGQGVGREGEYQQARTGAAVGRLILWARLLPPHFRVAGDHRGPITGKLAHGGVEPVRIDGRHNQPRVAHGERFRKRLFDSRRADHHGSDPRARRVLAARSTAATAMPCCC